MTIGGGREATSPGIANGPRRDAGPWGWPWRSSRPPEAGGPPPTPCR